MASLLDAKFGSESEEDDEDYNGRDHSSGDSSEGSSSFSSRQDEEEDSEEDGEEVLTASLRGCRERKKTFGEDEGRGVGTLGPGSSGVHTPGEKADISFDSKGDGRNDGGQRQEDADGQVGEEEDEKKKSLKEDQEENGNGEVEFLVTGGSGRRSILTSLKKSLRGKDKRGKRSRREDRLEEKKKKREEEALRKAKLNEEVASVFSDMSQESSHALQSYVSSTSREDILLQFHRRSPPSTGVKKNETLDQLYHYLSIAVSSSSSSSPPPPSSSFFKEGFLDEAVSSLKALDGRHLRAREEETENTKEDEEEATKKASLLQHKSDCFSSSPCSSSSYSISEEKKDLVASFSSSSSLSVDRQKEGGGKDLEKGTDMDEEKKNEELQIHKAEEEERKHGENGGDTKFMQSSLSSSGVASGSVHTAEDFSIQAIKKRVREQAGVRQTSDGKKKKREEEEEGGDKGRRRRTRAEEVKEMVRQAILEASQEDAGEILVKKVVRFAGQTVEVEKAMEAESADYRAFLKQQEKSRQRQLGGKFAHLDSLVSALDGPATINSVQKSQADWDKFKRDTGIEAELKSGHGYLDKQAFLAETEWRQHEKNVEIRRRLQLQQQMQQAPPPR